MTECNLAGDWTGKGMAMAVELRGRPPRRTQAQRSAEMRERLLDATIACLVENGYAATSTARVADKAGTTRGAQLHHFPSKESLVVAAIDHLARRRAQAAIGEIGRRPDGHDPVSAVLRFLWESHQGPLFIATVELSVAARTDSVLAQEIKRVEPLVNDTIASAVAQLLPDRTEHKALRNAIFTAMDALHGIMLLAMVDHDTSSSQRRWDRACADLRPIMTVALHGRAST